MPHLGWWSLRHTGTLTISVCLGGAAELFPIALGAHLPSRLISTDEGSPCRGPWGVRSYYLCTKDLWFQT